MSDKTLEMHFKLYEGYVSSTNKLNDQLHTLVASGKAASTDAAYAEITRGLGFEYNGMILHEHYFGNLKRQPGAQPSKALAEALSANFGSVERFMADFKAIGGMRGVGWAILFQDPASSRLSSHWISLHQDGHPAGYKPLLVMDVWEHAFLLDYKPSERAKYMDAFFSNVDWEAVSARFREPLAGVPAGARTVERPVVTEPVVAVVSEPVLEGDQPEMDTAGYPAAG
jgi:Fe-Mn family superoxide dismutase